MCTATNYVGKDHYGRNLDLEFSSHESVTVTQQRGCVEVGDKYEITIYSSCCNTDKGIDDYTTYENSQVTAGDLPKVDLDGDTLSSYPLVTGQQVRTQN
jgi:choloylglycine hydrolase